jgi:hypothetical protein
MRSLRLLATLSLMMTVLLISPATNAKPRDAETWVSIQVAPALVRELAHHPRFKGETIRIVVFADDRPAARSSVFALSLRDRLSAAVFDTQGIRMAAQQRPSARVDCALDEVDYYIGLQVTAVDDGRIRIDLRTLDLEDQTWVTGLDYTWQGVLTPRQQRSLEESRADPYFRGHRAAPFDESQTDMLAASLARELACASMRQTAGEFVVLISDDSDDPLRGTTDLVGNNLAWFAKLRFTDDPERANAVLRGKAHAVDSGLQQYWATLAPIEPGSDLPTLNASAYVRVAERPASHFDIPRSAQSVLSSAQLVEVATGDTCRMNRDSCLAMHIQTNRAAVVFFLNHQKSHGLVRLSNRECSTRPDARILRARESMSMPLPVDVLSPDAVSSADAWPLAPEGDTYYAIAVSNSEAAHVLSRLLQRLPQRCTAAVRFGLQDESLQLWMTEFANTVDKWRDDVDWQGIQVRNVY